MIHLQLYLATVTRLRVTNSPLLLRNSAQQNKQQHSSAIASDIRGFHRPSASRCQWAGDRVRAPLVRPSVQVGGAILRWRAEEQGAPRYTVPSPPRREVGVSRRPDLHSTRCARPRRRHALPARRGPSCDRVRANAHACPPTERGPPRHTHCHPSLRTGRTTRQ